MIPWDNLDLRGRIDLLNRMLERQRIDIGALAGAVQRQAEELEVLRGTVERLTDDDGK